MVSFEWKTSKHHENRELVYDFIMRVSVDNCIFFPAINILKICIVKIILLKKFNDQIYN